MSWGIRNATDRAAPADALRRLLARDGATAVAGVFDPLSALIAERAGIPNMRWYSC